MANISRKKIFEKEVYKNLEPRNSELKISTERRTKLQLPFKLQPGGQASLMSILSLFLTNASVQNIFDSTNNYEKIRKSANSGDNE